MSVRPTATADRAPGQGMAAWFVLAVLLLFSIAAPINQFKAPPIIPILIDEVGFSVGSAGWLMSVFSITGLVLALPAGLIYQRLGPQRTGLLAGGSIVLGASLGALSQGAGPLLATRIIEGMGTSFMAVLAPAVIAQWFAKHERGAAMGIWAVWVPVGTTSMFIGAPLLAQAGGWRAVWWLGAAYAVVVTVLYLLFVKPAPTRCAPARSRAETPSGMVTAAQVWRDRTIWLVSISFGLFNAATIGTKTYLPTFLAEQRGLPLEQAAAITSLLSFMILFSAPAGGALSDRLGSRKKVYLAGTVLTLLVLPLVGVLSSFWLIIAAALGGLVMGVVPPNIFAAAVEAARDERHGGTAMSVVMMGSNAGMLAGPLIFGTLAESVGWPAAFANVAVLVGLALATGWLAKAR